MKKLFLSSACLLFAMAMSAQSIFVGTYNIRNRNDGDEKKGNVWATRSTSRLPTCSERKRCL